VKVEELKLPRLEVDYAISSLVLRRLSSEEENNKQIGALQQFHDGAMLGKSAENEDLRQRNQCRRQ
jgi:hypothetical protein